MANPETIDRFQILKLLGSGATGLVYQANDPKLGRCVALKVSLPPERLTEQRKAALLREAQATAHLKHVGIVSVFEVIQTENAILLVREFVFGEPLDSALKKHSLDLRSTVQMVYQLARTIDYAHSKGVVHRDLKPANIILPIRETELARAEQPIHSVQLLSQKFDLNHPKVIDFGIANNSSPSNSKHENEEEFATLAYASPEQLGRRSDPVDHRTDVYSLGVILFELLTGERPYRGTVHVLRHQIIHDLAPSPRLLNQLIPVDIETITLKCLEKNPTTRFSTANEFADELERWLNGYPILSRPPTRLEIVKRWCQRNPAITTLCGILACVFLTGFAIVLNQWRQAERQRHRLEASEFEVTKNRKLVIEEREKVIEATSQADAAEKQAIERQAIAIQETKKADLNTENANREQLRAENNRRLVEQAIEEYLKLLNENPQLKKPENVELQRELLAEIKSYAKATFGTAEATNDNKAERNHQREMDSSETIQPAKLEAIRILLDQSKSEMLENQFVNAERTSQQALGKALQLAPSAQGLNAQAECYLFLGIILGNQQQYGKAERQFQEGLQNAKKSIEKAPSLVTPYQTLASIFRFRGEFFFKQSQPVQAAKMYEQAIKIQKQLVEVEPDSIIYQHQLSLAHNNLGIMYNRIDQVMRAANHFRVSIKIDKKLVDQNPDVSEYSIDLAGSYCNLASVERKNDESLDYYNQAVAILEPLVKRKASPRLARQFLLNSYKGRMIVLRELGKSKQSELDFARFKRLEQELSNNR